MSCAVRLATYSGVVAMPLANQGLQYVGNAEFMVQEPPLGRVTLTADVVAVSSSPSLAPVNTKLLRIEVQKGNVVHYEVSKTNATPVTATTDSPTVSGRELVDFGPGYTISLLIAGGEA